MKENQNLFGYAAILFGLGFVVRSFVPAHAFNGPDTSMGTHPIENVYGWINLSGGGTGTVLSNNTNQKLVIKTLRTSSQSCLWSIDSTMVFAHNYHSTSYTGTQSNTYEGLMLILDAGSVLSFKNRSNHTNYCSYYVEGEYVHTP